METWGWFAQAWVVAFGLATLVAMGVSKEFAFAHHAAWLSWIFGIPAATAVAGIFFGIGCIILWARGRREPPTDPELWQKELQKVKRTIQIAWIAGIVATIAAFFANLNPFGGGEDFSVTNAFDALITGGLTYGLYKRQTVPALLLFLYFVLWKMPLWSELQPKATVFAGIIMALYFWRGFAGVLRERKIKFYAALAEGNQKYGKMLKRLAN